MSWAKVHLLSSPHPIHLGVDQPALCGRVIAKAEAVVVVDWESAPLTETRWSYRLGCCRRCVVLEKDKAERYLYAIIPGEESMGEES